MKTVSLEISKQLKEVGYPQESSHYWNKPMYEKWELINYKYEMQEEKFIYASPTADEILEILPRQITKNNKTYSLMVFFPVNLSMKDEVRICYQEGDWDHGVREESDLLWSEENKIIADSAAKMWLYLKKEGLII